MRKSDISLGPNNAFTLCNLIYPALAWGIDQCVESQSVGGRYTYPW